MLVPLSRQKRKFGGLSKFRFAFNIRSIYYAEPGKELLDQHDPEKVKGLLKEAGYHAKRSCC